VAVDNSDDEDQQEEAAAAGQGAQDEGLTRRV